MKKTLFVLTIFAVILYAGSAFAILRTIVDKDKVASSSSSSSSTTQVDSSTVDLRDKDTTKPVKLLR